MAYVTGQFARLRQAWTVGDTRLVLLTFTATLFLSAVLLFSVQPMFARMVLPKLGGSPSVWAVSMCFFQAVLLAGYCYAHLLSRYLRQRLIPIAHMAVLALAMFTLPIGLADGRAEPPVGDAYGWLIVTLALGVGLPFFAVSANAPLLQAWFARTGHPHAGDPYFLYGASNLGSLVALLAYPTIIEPFSGLADQAALWASGFVILAMMIALCGMMMSVALGAAGAGANARAADVPARLDARQPTLQQRASWVALAFVPSGLLVAFTSYVTTDIASAPFLWVLPLAMFLSTFVLVFRDKPYIPHRWMLFLQPVATLAVLLGMSLAGNRGWQIAAVGGIVAFFAATMVCHRELFERRPESRHLTEFYLWMSLGGVLGGIFAALVAPQIFNAIWEYPLLLVLAMACRPGVAARIARQEMREIVAIAGLATVAFALVISLQLSGATGSRLGQIMLIGFGLLALLRREKPHALLVLTAVAALAIAALPSPMNRGDAERSFFGTHRVAMTSDGKVRLLMHGTTLHGADRLIAEDGSLIERPVPMTYYHPQSPMALGAEVARASKLKGEPIRVGIVGLGTGAMACNSRPEEAWRFYEIDPVVVRIASDPSRFRYLSSCRPNADVVLGDARLTLAREPAATFDYLVIDAFSSDAVPVHLLTVEALTLYLQKLSPDGLLALHVSNRHLDLVSVATAVAGAVPGVYTAIAVDRPQGKGFDRTSSQVVLVSRSPAVIDRVLAWPFAQPAKPPLLNAWTDDYSDILSALWLRYGR
ncbi:MAG: spermidine synthase [Hyphomicrobiaceae bacterium]